MRTLRRVGIRSVVLGALASGLLISLVALAGNAPLAVSPGTGAGTLIAGACPTFSWTSVAGAQSYELVAYRVPDASLSQASQGDLQELWRVRLPGTAQSWTPDLDRCFPHGGRYAWAVRAQVDGHMGAWSEVNLFSIKAVPSGEEVRSTIVGLRRFLGEMERAQGSAAAGERAGVGAAATLETRPAGGDQSHSESRLKRTLATQLPRDQGGRTIQGRPQPSSMKAQERQASGAAVPFGSGSASVSTATPSLGAPSFSVDANISLGSSSNMFKNGSTFLWNDTTGNTALGDSALASVSGSATGNTAVGAGALQATTGGSHFYEGSYNTAFGRNALLSNTTGRANTASGALALFGNTTGFVNTATGYYALKNNTTGFANTATGSHSLNDNTTGNANTATGAGALYSNTTGFQNTASGYRALLSNTTGVANTATGAGTLSNNTTGCCNTATGEGALYYNTTGMTNTATGGDALKHNTTGSSNTASGFIALAQNTSGFSNTASGDGALSGNTTGFENTASGANSLVSNTTGDRNVALGYRAGFNATTGSDNIFIGSEGMADDAGTIKIGTQGTQTSSFVAGISGVTVSGDPVVVSSTGQLGVSGASSRRFKEDVEEIGEASERLLELRPVSFHYKTSFSSDRRIQYGLIAEEVAKVFPELVVQDADGRPERIRYELLTPILLDELQKEHRSNQEQQEKIAQLEERVTARARQLVELEKALLTQKRELDRLAEQMTATSKRWPLKETRPPIRSSVAPAQPPD